MPKVAGSSMDECMETCMSDPQTREEYPDSEKRREVCAGACSSHVNDDS